MPTATGTILVPSPRSILVPSPIHHFTPLIPTTCYHGFTAHVKSCAASRIGRVDLTTGINCLHRAPVPSPFHHFTRLAPTTRYCGTHQRLCSQPHWPSGPHDLNCLHRTPSSAGQLTLHSPHPIHTVVHSKDQVRADRPPFMMHAHSKLRINTQQHACSSILDECCLVLGHPATHSPIYPRHSHARKRQTRQTRPVRKKTWIMTTCSGDPYT